MREHEATARRFFVAIVRGARDVQGEGYYSDENLEIFSKYTRLASTCCATSISMPSTPT